MGTVFGYLKKYWIFAVLAALFMVAEVGVDLLQPRMMEKIVDQGILGLGIGGKPDIGIVASTGVKMVIFVIAGGLCGILSATCMNMASQKAGNDIRKDSFSRIMNLSLQQTDKFTTGSLITRITNDVSQVQGLFTSMLRGVVRCFAFFFGGSFALLSLDMSFRMILIIALPIILLDIILVMWKANPLFSLLQSKLDKLNDVIQENVSGARVVKAFIQEDRETERFKKTNKDLVDTQFRVFIVLSFLRPVMNIVLNLAVVAIIYIGGIRVREGAIEPGVVMAAITYISQILTGMMMLAMIFQNVSRGVVSANRIKEVLKADPAIASGDEDLSDIPDDERGSIRFENVSFRYPGAEADVLTGIDLTVGRGETLAIIGATGCGKSTLVNLIPRFYDATAGSVYVDGRDVKELSVTDLRDRVTVCLQKSELFADTIKNNIAMGKTGATDDEIFEAARSAQAEDFILQQPDGYETEVAQGGMSLSGGQKQRIAISRALLKRSEIMIFDDSTSALDLRTEAGFYEALNTRYKDSTKILIAQRIASVKGADRIAVIDNGTIAGCGTHEELLKTCRVYQDICASQETADYSGREAS